MSQRDNKSFIKLNCAAIPSGLLESELFGHEKGAFTGAVARKLGRLELADKGTLFLDEIGEIPLSLQPKLLRVLQDMEFERLGSTQTLKVNFRLLAATNRDLLHSVKMREFRSDLYYRLNVFPIVIPPLRERREDIRALVEHFVRKFSSADEEIHYKYSRQHHGDAGAVGVAGQHTGVGEFCGAFGYLVTGLGFAVANLGTGKNVLRQWRSNEHDATGKRPGEHFAGTAGVWRTTRRAGWSGGTPGIEAHHSAIQAGSLGN